LRASKEVRNQQFEYIGELRERYAARGHAIISIDTKKREMVGNFKNAGATYEQDAQDVFDHDFLSNASGVAIPYGIYDTRSNCGAVFVGTSYDTPEFAVDCIAGWWKQFGRHRYEPKILILADGGGSNGCRPRMWKWQLQKVLCEGCGLEISVSHYPAGYSNGVAEGNALPIDYNGVGDDGGVMDKIGGHLKYNLDTGELPEILNTRSYVLEVTVTDISTGESVSEMIPIQAK